MNRRRKPKPKKSKRADFLPSIGVRSEPVLPDGERIDCDLTTRTYRADMKTLDEKNRSIECVVATEDRVKVVDWQRYEVIEEILRMDGLKMPANGQVPLLDTHNRYSVQHQHGSTRDFRVEGNKLIGRNYYSSSDDSEHAWTLCREGHLTDNSVGYRIGDDAVIIEAGKRAEVAGQNYKASPNMALRVVLSWEIRENSICPIGADPQAKTRKQQSPIAGQIQSIRKETEMKKFKEWLQARGLVYDDMDDAQRTALKADFDAECQRAEAVKLAAKAADDGQRSAAADLPAGVGTDDGNRQVAALTEADAARIANEAVAAEHTRQSGIRTEANGLGIDEETIARCVNDTKMTVEAARGEFLEVIRKRGGNPVQSAPGGFVVDQGVDGQRLADAMLLRAGFDDVVLAETDGEKRAEKAEQFRDLTALDLCRQALMLEGKTPAGGREDMIRAALSTMTLPTILGAIYNKSLLKGYTSVEETWRKFCNIGSAPDFKTITRVRLTGTGAFQKIADGGDLKLGGAEEEKEQYNLETFGKKDRFGRQAIINDDLGVLTRVAQRHGRRGKLKIAELVYTHLLANGNMDDGVALFHASHSNLNTSKSLTKANIANAIMRFKKQTDKDGKSIGVRPVFLLVPVELEDTALEYVTSELIVLAGSTDSVRGNKNTLKNKLEVIADPLLSDSSLTGYSATSWFLAGSPKQCDTIEVGFLNGRQVPTVHMNPKATDMYMEFEGYIDVAAKALDHRTMQKNTA